VPAPQVYAVTGVVMGLELDERTVRVRHQEIPGYMAAMTMPFEVKDTNEIAGLEVGDVVTFRMLVTDDDGWIDTVRVVGFDETVLPVERAPVRQVRMVEPLNPGDLVPDYVLTNELGQRISLGQFRGKALGLTFIFTRCPYPKFCPRQCTLFAEGLRRLASAPGGPTNWHLLSVSFDPQHDTPPVLRDYAQRYQYDPARWTFATGSLIDIDALTEQFGMLFARDGELFSHNLRTVVLDARGRVYTNIVGNTWTAEDLVAAMTEAARVR
jgi:protein SCO1/2